MISQIEWVELRHIRMRLRSDFRTSFGLERDRDCVLVRISSDGLEGWGECVAGAEPGYSYETVGTAWHILSEFFVPSLFEGAVSTPESMRNRLKAFRGHPLARAGLEMAFWDLTGKRGGRSFSELIGGSTAKVAVGVSIGIQENPDRMLDQIEYYLDQGYQRVKIKIAPGSDVEVIEAVRSEYPHLNLWVDANAAYTMDDLALLRSMDAYGLGLLEQPLYEDDLIEHAHLQAQISTDLCLDESVHHLRDARHAIDLGACRVINIKPGRVGGYQMACEIEGHCQQRGIPVWCGGMLETGIGRAANLALASRSGFSLPGDISASERYYEQDICEPKFELNSDSTIDVPAGPGLGIQIDMPAIEAVTLDRVVLKPS
ncbi:MAG: o-succinylbenzoate synthase [Anaerolineales bacterium]|jgi:O-succinylbenzoate synthase